MYTEEIFQLVWLKDNEKLFKIINDIDINITDNYNGGNLLQEAIVAENFDLVIKLIKKWININHQDKNLHSALSYLADRKLINITKLILEAWWNVNMKDKHWNTPLWRSIIRSGWKYELIKLFMQYWWNSNIENNYWKSPMWLAKDIWDKKLIDILNKKSK